MNVKDGEGRVVAEKDSVMYMREDKSWYISRGSKVCICC